MNIYQIVGVAGVAGGIVCGLADVPLVKDRRDGYEIRDRSLRFDDIRPWWAEASEERFRLSFWLSFLGQPCAYLTMWMLAVLIGRSNPGLGLALKANTFLSAYTGLMCHADFCIKPVLYHRIAGKLPEDDARRALRAQNICTMPPMAAGFLTLYLGTTVLVTAAILTGALPVSRWFALCNPIVSTIVLMTLKKLGVPIIGTLGVGFSLFAVVLLAAGGAA